MITFVKGSLLYLKPYSQIQVNHGNVLVSALSESLRMHIMRIIETNDFKLYRVTEEAVTLSATTSAYSSE